jgi:hypothetical protein
MTPPGLSGIKPSTLIDAAARTPTLARIGELHPRDVRRIIFSLFADQPLFSLENAKNYGNYNSNPKDRDFSTASPLY